MCTADNSGHTFTVLRTFAQIRLRRTSYVLGTLGENWGEILMWKKGIGHMIK